MHRYVPKHARKRRGLPRVAALSAVLALVVLAGLVFIVLRGLEAVEARPVSPAETTAVQARPVATTGAVTTAVLESTTLPSSTTTARLSTTTTIRVHPIPSPVRLVIPAIDVDAKLVPVGLLENGDMEVPSFGLAGWYDPGPVPGANGPAVVVAHVDTKKGPDVFFRLKELRPGDEIVICGEDGDAARFVVDAMEQQLKSDLPIERIWNDTWQPVIRLITCGGEFDRSSGHYLSNVIVYGHLAE